MMDLVYFGHEQEEKSKELEKEFIEEITKDFPNVELKDSYDEIKGYRQSVYFPDEQKDEYHAWLIAKGWFEMSLTMQIIIMGNENDDIDRLLKLAKEKYPESFKPDENNN